MLIGGWLAAAALGFPATATAQGAGPTDPDATSPSGVIYEIPLEGARRDAAPRSGRGGRTRGGGQNPAFRSENNFGSSSTVPGSQGDESRDDGGGSPGGSGSSGGGGAGTSGGENASGKSAAGRFAGAASSASDDPSVPGTVILVLAVLAGAVLSAVAAIRARRSSS